MPEKIREESPNPITRATVKAVALSQACQAIYEDLSGFAGLFSSDIDSAVPAAPLSTKRKLFAMSAKHLPARFYRLVDDGSVYADYLLGKNAGDVIRGRAIFISKDPELLEECSWALSDEDLELFELSDVIGDMLVLWKRAAANCPELKSEVWPDPFSSRWWEIKAVPFTCMDAALEASGINGMLQAYFSGVPLGDLTVSAGFDVSDRHESWGAKMLQESRCR